MRDQALEVAAQQRLAAGETDLLDSDPDELAREPLDLLEGQELLAVEEPIAASEDLLRHAVDAAEVAAIRHRDPEIAQWASERVHGLRVPADGQTSDRTEVVKREEAA